MVDYIKDVSVFLELIGGKENILFVIYCVMRMCFVL